MKKKIIIGVVIVAIIGIIGGIQFTSRNKKQIITVKTSKVAIGDVKMYLSTTATIKSKNEKDYAVSAATKISNVKVSVGDKVKKGDIILIYDTADLNNQLESAQINYNNAISQKKDAVNKNDNANILSDEKIIQLDNAVLAAQNTLDSVKIKLSQNSNITSDIDGVVTEVNEIGRAHV